VNGNPRVAGRRLTPVIDGEPTRMAILVNNAGASPAAFWPWSLHAKAWTA
jgi:hypothetical protein